MDVNQSIFDLRFVLPFAALCCTERARIGQPELVRRGGVTPAMEARLADHVWGFEEILDLGGKPAEHAT
ncbi:MAG: hypothetical protein Q7J25_05730 [Vicinamibacterales bacterium]|nr:hypothetical protein [Vicinamibacterales bacterium]